jgi:hypothetical protein
VSGLITGIDPGKTGFIVTLDVRGELRFAAPLPYIDRFIDETALLDILRPLQGGTFVVERQFVKGGQGMGGMGNAMLNYGTIRGMLAALGCRRDYVRAQDWQKAMLRGEHKATGKDLKALYTAAAERQFPVHQFRGPQGGLWDGKAAAALMAEYGRRLLIGEQAAPELKLK